MGTNINEIAKIKIESGVQATVRLIYIYIYVCVYMYIEIGVANNFCVFCLKIILYRRGQKLPTERHKLLA